MALTNDDLKAIKELLNPVNERLDKLDGRMDKLDGRVNKLDGKIVKLDERLEIVEYKQDRTAKKLEDLRFDVTVAERDIRRDIHELKDKTETIIEILKQHEFIPL